MFNISKNNLVIDELYTLTIQKINLKKENKQDIKTISKLVNEQRELINYLRTEYTEQSRFLAKQLKILVEQLSKQTYDKTGEKIKTTKTQGEILRQFLENDLKNLLNECILLEPIFIEQNKQVQQNNLEKYYELLIQESNKIQELKQTIEKDSELEKRFANAYGDVKHIDYNELLAKLKHKVSKLMSKYSIEKPIGVENIPLLGPVLIAPRHYEAGIDSAALFAAIPRRTFIMAGVDWVQTGTQNFASRIMYKGLGVLKINRQSKPTPTLDNPNSTEKITASPYYNRHTDGWALNQAKLLLNSKEAIIIFPEGWANEGRTQGTILKSNGVLPAQSGFINVIEDAQKQSTEKICIIPTGLLIDENKKTIQAVFGEPMYYENKFDKNRIQQYRDAFGKDLMSKIKTLSNI